MMIIIIIIIIITVVRLPQFYFVSFSFCCCVPPFLRAFCWPTCIFLCCLEFSSQMFIQLTCCCVLYVLYSTIIIVIFHNFFSPLLLKEVNVSAIMRRLIMKYIFNKSIKVVFSCTKRKKRKKKKRRNNHRNQGVCNIFMAILLLLHFLRLLLQRVRLAAGAFRNR